MKVKASIRKNVKEATENCHRVLVKEIINLMKTIGANDGQDVSFGETVYLYEYCNNTVNVILCDMIAYAENAKGEPFLVIYKEGDATKSDWFLSLTSLEVIYRKLYKLVLKY